MSLRHKSYKRQGWLGGLLLAGSAMFLFLAVFSATAVLAEVTPQMAQSLAVPAPVSAGSGVQSPRSRASVPNRAGGAASGGVGVRGAAPVGARSGHVPNNASNQYQEVDEDGNVINQPGSAAPGVARPGPVRGPSAVSRGGAAPVAGGNANQSRAAVSTAVRPGVQGASGAPGARPAARAVNPTGRGSVSAAPRAGATNITGGASGANQSRAAAIGVAGPSGSSTRAASPRAVSKRARGNVSENARGAAGRNVAARSATNNSVQQARVSLSGSAMRSGVRGNNQSNLQAAQFQQVTFSNLIDPLTGMLAADVYSGCFEAYYACMDEICTVRRPGQRRCACAGRVKTFNDVESQLISARETLLRVSGELSLIVMTRGESIQSAFELTEAERSINCVSYRDMVRSGGAKNDRPRGDSRSTELEEWCKSRNMSGVDDEGMGATGTSKISWNCSGEMDEMCKGVFGSDWMNVLNGADSDILAGLKQYADQINKVDTMVYKRDEDDLLGTITNVNNMTGGNSNLFAGVDKGEALDQLAQTWGYNLFAYAHNNVCSRVMDSCFNGVFEMCGTRPAEQGGGTGPYNMNSQIRVTNDDDVDFNVAGNGTTVNIGTPVCFGYTNNQDPFRDLRRPIAQARLSILQRYVLDANSDCDVWGENLRGQLQNVDLQRVAATQMLQKMRLEFAQEKEKNRNSELVAAKQDFIKCIDEIQQCRNDQDRRQSSRCGQRNAIVSFCNQMSQVPACYRTMVCNMDASELVSSTENSELQNTVLLSEILATSSPETTREKCLKNTLGVDSNTGTNSIRHWQVTADCN